MLWTCFMWSTRMATLGWQDFGCTSFIPAVACHPIPKWRLDWSPITLWQDFGSSQQWPVIQSKSKARLVSHQLVARLHLHQLPPSSGLSSDPKARLNWSPINSAIKICARLQYYLFSSIIAQKTIYYMEKLQKYAWYENVQWIYLLAVFICRICWHLDVEHSIINQGTYPMVVGSAGETSCYQQCKGWAISI